jgi:hypothetical protein
MKNDFRATTKVKKKNAMALQEASHLASMSTALIATRNFKWSTRPYVFWGMDHKMAIPIVIDTGASISVTGITQDFIRELQGVDPDVNLQGLNNKVKVEGVGTVHWTIHDQYNWTGNVKMMAYFVPDAEVHLFSPQLYFKEVDTGKLVITKDKTTLETQDGSILSFPINH